MSKKNRTKKEDQKAILEARKFTFGKVVRLTLKMFVFAILASLVVTLLAVSGLPGFDQFWVQVLVMVLFYIPAYPIVMSEFRPKTARTRPNK